MASGPMTAVFQATSNALTCAATSSGLSMSCSPVSVSTINVSSSCRLNPAIGRIGDGAAFEQHVEINRREPSQPHEPVKLTEHRVHGTEMDGQRGLSEHDLEASAGLIQQLGGVGTPFEPPSPSHNSYTCDVTEIPLRELRNETSAVLRRVEEGERHLTCPASGW